MTKPTYENLDFDLLDLGEALCQWHASQGDPIYAVGSYANTGEVHPDRDTVESALTACERLIRTQTSDENQAQLGFCIDSLEEILRKWPAPAEEAS
jgi:hypothetical protein